MVQQLLSIRDRWDRAGIWLSGLCALHCLAGVVLVSLLGLGGEFLLAPLWHEVGLAAALLVGILSLGLGVWRHRAAGPLLIGGFGLALMAAGLATEHGIAEAALTVCGVALLAYAHVSNLRHAR